VKQSSQGSHGLVEEAYRTELYGEPAFVVGEGRNRPSNASLREEINLS